MLPNTKRGWIIAGVALVLCIGIVVFLFYLSHKPVEPGVTYVMPKKSSRAELPSNMPSVKDETFVKATVKTEEHLVSGEKILHGTVEVTAEELQEFLDIVKESTDEETEPESNVQVSPFGFGAFPKVPDDFPESVIWQSDMQSDIDQWGSSQIKAVELMDRVLVKLWKQGHQATSAHTASNGKIYPSYPNTVYLDLAYKTDSEGNTVVSRGRLSGYDGITESEIDAIMEGNIPPGITVLSYSDDGIDPYSFLNLN